MIDFDHINKELSSELREAFQKAIRHWSHGNPICVVPRLWPVSSSPPAIGDIPKPDKIINDKWEFRRDVIEQISDFPLTHFYLNCNGEWRLIAVHGEL